VQKNISLSQNLSLNTKVDDNIVELIETLENIDESLSISKLNETSISNNNGGRIVF